MAGLLSVLLGTSCGGVELESAARDHPIVIDGKANEWQDSLTVLEDVQMAVGLSNDEHDLYLCITSWNRDVNLQAMNLGLTLWFDPAGGDDRKFGVEYPVMEDLIQSKGPPAAGDVASLPEVSGRTASRLAVRGPLPWDRRVMALSDAPGIEVNVSSLNGTFVYELKVPLDHSAEHPFAIGAGPGRVVGMTLETTRAPGYREEQGPSGGPRSGRGGGGGGMGGHRHGGGGMRGGGGGPGPTSPDRPRMPKPLKFSAKVRLASVTASSGG